MVVEITCFSTGSRGMLGLLLQIPKPPDCGNPRVPTAGLCPTFVKEPHQVSGKKTKQTQTRTKFCLSTTLFSFTAKFCQPFSVYLKLLFPSNQSVSMLGCTLLFFFPFFSFSFFSFSFPSPFPLLFHSPPDDSHHCRPARTLS